MAIRGRKIPYDQDIVPQLRTGDFVANLAVALVRTRGGWKGSELSLEDVDDLDTLADLLRELDGADSSSAVLCFVEEDDEWFAIVRLAGDDDPRVFLSDRRMTDQSELAERL